MVFLRSPRTHITSLFLECKYSDWGGPRGLVSGFPWNCSDTQGLEAWLAYFETWRPSNDAIQQAQSNDFGCYNAASLQTRQLGDACVRNPHHLYRANWPQPASAAVVAGQRLDTFAFVGIMDLYDASYCLLTHRLGVPSPLGCFNPGERVTNTNVRHGGARPLTAAVPISATGLAAADRLTRDDQALYVAGVGRLITELQHYTDAGAGRPLAPYLLNLTVLEDALAAMGSPTAAPELKAARDALMAQARRLRAAMEARARRARAKHEGGRRVIKDDLE